jgi:hypothetical protein
MLHFAAIFCRNGCPTPRPTTNKPELLSLAAMRIAVVSIFVLLLAAARASVFELKDGDRVVFVGDSLIEGERSNGWIESRDGVSLLRVAGVVVVRGSRA